MTSSIDLSRVRENATRLRTRFEHPQDDALAYAVVQDVYELAEELERVAADLRARERLARRLWITSVSDDPTAQEIAAADWDRDGHTIERERWLAEADELLAIIEGKG